ncbi:52 kDa repressor of the inhibitor of the protein kinase [Triplophysa tibetana]|uniref:52 kDa repressor of the inhibitor of the protein kinase n=1 Tax=Triplophysa tibetana TaxID=1572043 RepID=A0A5A9N4I8_9TELE|nr:52 kDa repressor of the inhibitor of the protein kinase [Triplophysa tibetana]
MPNFCAALNCTRNSTHSVLAFFRFPRDPERCKKWVENCCRSDLKDKTPDHLNKYHRLCARHFEPNLITKTSPFRTVLKDSAIPTIFDDLSRKRPNQETKNNDAPEAKKDRLDEAGDTTKGTSEAQSQEVTESSNGDGADSGPQAVDEETLNKEHLKSLFDVVVMMGVQNIPLNGHSDKDPKSKSFTSSNLQALLEYRINAGDESLRKKFEMSAVNSEYCSSAPLEKMLDVIEKCARDELLAEVKEGRFFCFVIGSQVEVAGESHLPVFVRFVDKSNCLREEFVGFLLLEGDVEAITKRLIDEVTEKYGLDMQHCRGQGYFCSGVSTLKVKAMLARITELYPLATLTPCSNCSLNICLANSMTLTGVYLVMSTLKKLEAFFSKSPLLLNQLENAISIYYQGNDEKISMLKEACYSKWTEEHDAFEIAVDLLESLLLCMDSVHDNEDHKWNDEIAHNAFVISEALADFEFVMTLVVLKNTLSFSRAFGKNLQGQTNEVFSAATSLTAVLHSLNEVFENLEVYHEFWFEEAVNLATALEIPVKIPRLFFRKRPATGEEIQPETYYKENVTIPVVTHVIKELTDLFSENHLKALKSLSIVPAIMGQLKFNTSEETSAEMYQNDLPNPDTFPAELHCWKIKWKHGTKDVVLPPNIYETLQLSDAKFFPNVCALLKILHSLPVFALIDDKCSSANLRLKKYVDDTPAHHRNKSMALLHINCGIKHDLDTMVETYLKMYPDSEPTEKCD